MHLLDNPIGNYRFLTGIAPYSAGVVAMPGFEIVRATLQRPIPYQAGFDLIAAHLDTLDRPRAALCAVELRLPAPLTFAGFANFNAGYQSILAGWDLDETFNAENLGLFLRNFHRAGFALGEAYARELTGARLGN